MAVDINRYEQMFNVLIQQYKNSPNFLQFIEIIAEQLQDIQKALCDLWLFRSLDRAFGRQLDIIGEILGYDRPNIVLENNDIFTFENVQDSGLGFGDADNPSVGGRFIGAGINNTFIKLSDVEYKNRLRAKIIKNGAKGNIKDVLNYLELIYNNPVTLTIGTGYIDLEFYNFIPGYEIEFLRGNLPVPAGVRVRNVTIRQ